MSVLSQDTGDAGVHIEVIDDCSPRVDCAALVQKICGGRVACHREQKNLGLAGIWNRCIERAQGEWIHILHQDDLVMPGFYGKLEEGARASANPGLIYCRHAFMDSGGHWCWLSDLDARTSGLLSEPLIRLVCSQRIQTPSVIVRRSVYKDVGGFRSDLCYALDWEMWCRIAAKYPVWYEPAILACYRMHDSTTTSRLVREGKDVDDSRKCILLVSGYLSGPTAKEVRERALLAYALRAMNTARTLVSQNEFRSAFRQFIGAFKCSIHPRVLKQALVITVLSAVRWLKTLAPLPTSSCFL